jgi:cyclophilin family peptidyl-prolyl cis-trans isomerase
MTAQIPIAPTNQAPVSPKNRIWVWVVVIVCGIICLCVVLVILGILLLRNNFRLPISGSPASTPTSYLSNPTPYLIGTKQYSFAPPMLIDTSKQYFATVKMANGGEFVIQLYPDKAPITVNSFVFLAQQGFFNGTTFHRVLEGFMAQGGDPTGTGMGGPGYEFINEVNDLAFDKPGVVAMANAGRDTNGSQFFIMFVPYGLSESDYTIFGQIISGMDVVNAITRRDPMENPTFTGDVIESINITEK